MDTIWKDISEDKICEIFGFCKDYIDFLNKAKTEREAVTYFKNRSYEKGFVSFDEMLSGNAELKPGTKIFKNIRNKSFIAAVIGKKDLEEGVLTVGAHIDSPRLDLKPNPIYEDTGIGYLKTHYYGGIKKYQWVTIPLSLHGVICKADGTKVEFSIGDKDDEPCFTISDLLPHLSQEQVEKTASKVIPAENLNIIAASFFKKDKDDKDSVKEYIIREICDKYGVTEAELKTAEIEAVPAIPAKEIGFDKSLIAGYGQDDRICAYTGFMALYDLTDIPEKTCIVYCSDKEEIGSMGNTGAQSFAFRDFILELINLYDKKDTYLSLRRCLSNTQLLSADVTAAFDPTYGDAYDKSNAAFLGKGVALQKYTGARGKSGASDANSEFISEIASKFEKNNIPWQINEMGKTDLGGGGTIAQYMANQGIDVVDCGVPILSMHSPYELSSKADIYWTYKAYNTFFC